LKDETAKVVSGGVGELPHPPPGGRSATRGALQSPVKASRSGKAEQRGRKAVEPRTSIAKET